MQNKKKRGLLVGVVTALLACMCVFIALAGCSRAPETYRPESPSVGAQPPRDGSTPEDYDPLENIGYVIGRLAEREYYHSENTNRAEATSLGFIRVEQNVQGSKDYKDGILITSTVSTSSSSFAPSKAIQKYYGDRSVIVRTAASADPADWDGLHTVWSMGAPAEILDEETYGARYGLWATEFSDFVINEETVLSASELTREGNDYSISFDLSVSGDNDATYYYKKQMVTMGELSAEPQFSSVRLTVRFSSDWSVLSASTEEIYTSQKGIISANVVGSSETVFSYDEADVDVSAYESYFRQYAESDAADHTADEYLAEGLSSVLDGKSVLSLHMQRPDSEMTGYVRMEGESANITSVRVRADAGSELAYEEGILYFMAGGMTGKLDLRQGGAAEAIALRGNFVEKQGENVSVSGRISLAGADIPVTVGLTESGGEIAFRYIDAEIPDLDLTLHLEKSDRDVAFAEIDADAAVDLTPLASDLLHFAETGRFTASAAFLSEQQEVSVAAKLDIAEEGGAFAVDADVALTVSNYTQDENGERVQSDAHYVHMILQGGQLYVNYSLKEMDAPTGLRARMAVSDLAAAAEKVSSLLELCGIDLSGVNIAGGMPFMQADGSAILTAGLDEYGNHTASVAGFAVAGGTLDLSLTAAKSGVSPVAAPSDAESYLDVSFLARLVEDVCTTAGQIGTGFDLSAKIKADLFGVSPLADLDLTARIGHDARGEVEAVVQVRINAGGAVFFGDTESTLVIRGGNVFISRVQTSVYEEVLAGTGEEVLETPLRTQRAMTMEHFFATAGDQLLYFLNVNSDTISSLGSLAGGMGGGEQGDVGEMITLIESNAEGYSLAFDLGKMLGMESLGTLAIDIGRNEGGTLTAMDINAALLGGLVNASVQIENRAPGAPVDLSDITGIVSEIGQALGYEGEEEFLAAIAANGCIPLEQETE